MCSPPSPLPLRRANARLLHRRDAQCPVPFQVELRRLGLAALAVLTGTGGTHRYVTQIYSVVEILVGQIEKLCQVGPGGMPGISWLQGSLFCEGIVPHNF